MEVTLPQLRPTGLDEQALELAHRQYVGQRLALLRRPQRQRRIADQSLLLDEEAEEELERRGRPRLARDGRPPLLLLRQEGPQVRHLHLASSGSPDPAGNPGTPRRHARTPSKSSGQAAAPTRKSAGNRPVPSSHRLFIAPPLGSLAAPAGASLDYPAYQPAWRRPRGMPPWSQGKAGVKVRGGGASSAAVRHERSTRSGSCSAGTGRSGAEAQMVKRPRTSFARSAASRSRWAPASSPGRTAARPYGSASGRSRNGRGRTTPSR